MAAGRELFKLYGLIGLRGVERTKKELTQIEKQARKVQRELNNMGRKVSAVGKTLTKAFTVPLAVAGAAVFKFSADFDRAFTKSLAIMGNVSDEMKGNMRKTAIEVSKAIGISATKATESYYFLASAGLSAAQQIEALPRVARFAKAGMFEMALATDLLTDAQSALGLASKDTATAMKNMERVSDVLVGANTLANASVQQFSESITNKAGAALRLLGKDIEEGVAVLSVFADQGLKGAAAGESLNIVMRDLQRAYLKSTEQFKKSKVAVFDQNGEMRNMADIIKDLDKLLLTMSDEQRRATLSTLGFQDKSISATMALLGTSGAIAEYEKKLRKMSGTTKTVAEKQLKTFWEQMNLIKARLIAAGLSMSAFGKIGNKVIVPTLDAITSAVEGVVAWWNKLNSHTKKTIGGFTLLLVAIGPVVFALGKLIAFSKILIPLFVALKMGTVGWGTAMVALKKSMFGMVAVIGSLVAVGWYYYSQWSTISKQLKAIWEGLKLKVLNVASSIVNQFSWAVNKVLDIADKFSGIIPGIGAKIKQARISILKMRIELGKLTLAQHKNKQAAIEQAKAQGGFLESAKKAIDAAKEKLGITKDETEAIEEKTEKDLEAAVKAKQAAEARLQFEKDISAQLDELQLSEKEKLESDYQEKLIMAEQFGSDTFQIDMLYHIKRMELRKKEHDTALRQIENEKKEKRKEIKNGLRNTNKYVSQIAGIYNKFADNKLKRIDIEEQRQIKAIENSALSEEKKEAAIANIRAGSEKERRKIERQKAISEKAAALFSIAVNTAVAVVKALPNIPLSVAVGLLGIAQGIAVASQPIPELYEGAMIEGSEQGVTVQAGERNQDELFFPLQHGIDLIVSGIMEKISAIQFPSFEAPAAEVASAGMERSVHLHIGTLIADKAGLKMLERKLDKIRISENERKGVA